jgi:hypothetical protein
MKHPPPEAPLEELQNYVAASAASSSGGTQIKALCRTARTPRRLPKISRIAVSIRHRLEKEKQATKRALLSARAATAVSLMNRV